MTPRVPARGQKPVEPLLVEFVHVQQTIRRSPVEQAVLDVFPQDAGTLFVAAAEQAAAGVATRHHPGFDVMIMLMRHGHS